MKILLNIIAAPFAAILIVTATVVYVLGVFFIVICDQVEYVVGGWFID